jgi:hypothetical protein
LLFAAATAAKINFVYVHDTHHSFRERL